MVKPFIRSAKTGNNLLLLDFSIAGATAPNSPEALLTMIHAQVLFMMVLVQTIRPGTVCVHGGIPGITLENGDLSYSSSSQGLINEAMARLNLWVTGFPSAQSGGSTSVSEDVQTAVEESRRARNRLRRYGAHIIRHAFGALGNLQYFSLDKFTEDCSIEMHTRNGLKENIIGDMNVLPLFLPQDDHAMEAIVELAVKGNAQVTDHTLKNLDAFKKWEKRVQSEEENPRCEQKSCE
jgi:trimethylamine--corrinoid protein Co-methyltransferase